MKGDGWVCDQCGKTEVLASADRFAMAGRYGAPPVGWYVLLESLGVPNAESDRWEFCSTECVHARTKPEVARVTVSWHPDALDRALARLIRWRDSETNCSLNPQEQAVSVAIDALRALIGDPAPVPEDGQ